ncbi:MAG TPA: hypothetical protein VL598_10280 [Trinickia sp.]|jgi:hypothetical protein|uniref:hypothetical protein n=1 Tax=Trinickia sp. TaxID=2571163 RepID=UPI002C540D6C|nr:hypothetical protein [Trinickia sp.]HTI18040.1 hypothetical protein [Trinickia sp.]
MSFEHRGFRVSVDVVPDEADVQWLCCATIEGISEEARTAVIPNIELTIPRLKIDVLMALNMIEHRAVSSIDEWHDRTTITP